MVLIVLALPELANSAISPPDFERIWLLNNHRNLITRYQQKVELFRQNDNPIWTLALDVAENQTINTSDGIKDALLDRMEIHYQDEKYLARIDWLSLIPQPQTTEGFTYGDTVLGYSWHNNNDLETTVGIRLQSTPRTILSNGEPVFHLIDSASSTNSSGFFHLNYRGWDIGNYYSSDTSTQTNSINIPLLRDKTYYITIVLNYLSDIRFTPRYEASLEHSYRFQQHIFHSGLTMSRLKNSDQVEISSGKLHYTSNINRGLRYSAGLYYYNDLDNQRSYPGTKLGIEYIIDLQGELSFGLFFRQNAFADIDAMMLQDKPVLSFTMSARPEF
ncbi:MAG: hypothetical protein HUJ30_06300 [Gammaproteobacteria bacterium]|nr:hypothetical protein [Gammaproteobacteria bacterium]